MAQIEVIKPDNKTKFSTENSIKIFLAGSIEMGKAIDWQDDITNRINEFSFTTGNITIYNPRRDSWDSNWEQSEINPEFRYQVNWELNKLEESDIIFLNFVEDTMSPISLLELGHFASSGKIIACAPKKFYRRGNVEVVCSRFSVPLFDDYEYAFASLISRIELIMNKSSFC